MKWSDITRDIEFDDYGDFDLVSGDISVLTDKTLILRQNVIDRLKTSFRDYDLYPNLGADLNSCIGKSNSEALAQRVKENINYTLTFDGFLLASDFVLAIFQDKEKMFIKLEIATQLNITSEDVLSINILFNTITGVIYAS